MTYHVYISLAGESKLSIYTMDSETGALDFQEDVPLGGGPAPIAVDPQRRFLFVGLRSTREMSSFSIDRGTGGLSPIATVSLESDPCYISTDRTGRYLLSSYYGAGKVAVHSIGDGGALGSEPIEWLSTAEHAHCVQTDPSNSFAFVPHTVPPNAIFQFRFDADTGSLKPNSVARFVPEEKVGPRHYCFHPTKEIVYVVNEQGCSVTAYHFDPSAGTLAPFHTVSTLPAGFEGKNTCAQIHIAPSGRFLYASNRGHDSIACFSVDDATGELVAAGQQLTEEMPRAFNLDPEGEYLLAAGLVSGYLASYRIDGHTGALKPLERYAVGSRPMWVLVERLET